MYLWSSLYYHAILLTFSELRECHKNKMYIKPQQLRNNNNKKRKNKSQTVKFSTDNNTENFNYMLLNYSEKALRAWLR